jgi:ATP-dependent Clp protease adapter protein ClpS
MQTLLSFMSIKPNYDNNWHIILHEDSSLSAMYVVDVLMDVLKYDYDVADKIMQEALTNGRAIVITTDYSTALSYRFKLEQKELTVTLEEVR